MRQTTSVTVEDDCLLKRPKLLRTYHLPEILSYKIYEEHATEHVRTSKVFCYSLRFPDCISAFFVYILHTFFGEGRY